MSASSVQCGWPVGRCGHRWAGCCGGRVQGPLAPFFWHLCSLCTVVYRNSSGLGSPQGLGGRNLNHPAWAPEVLAPDEGHPMALAQTMWFCIIVALPLSSRIKTPGRGAPIPTCLKVPLFPWSWLLGLLHALTDPSPSLSLLSACPDALLRANRRRTWTLALTLAPGCQLQESEPVAVCSCVPAA